MKTIPILSSKSDAHRALIAAGLCRKPCRVVIQGTSEDIEATAHCMEAIRSAGQEAEGNITELYCRESGSTFRFMIPVVSALGITGRFHPEGRLPQRPLSPFYEELQRHGAEMSAPGEVPFLVAGKLRPGTYSLPGNVSSQFVTGLLLALPLLKEESTIHVTGERQSMGYIELTLQVIRQFGIQVETEESPDTYICRIPGDQEYHRTEPYIVEGDWSNAAFWLTAGVIGDEAVEVTGLRSDSRQGDRAIVPMLRQFGAEISVKDHSVTAFPSRGRLRGTTIDASQIPDLIPALALVAAVSDGTTNVEHAERLRLKESDRLQSITETLRNLGADVSERPDGLKIQGIASLHGGIADSHKDHRIAMMAAIASRITEGRVTIIGAESVRKSYPDFFTIMERNQWMEHIERR